MHECVWRFSIFREQERKIAHLSRSKTKMFVKMSMVDWSGICADADTDSRKISSTLIFNNITLFWPRIALKTPFTAPPHTVLPWNQESCMEQGSLEPRLVLWIKGGLGWNKENPHTQGRRFQALQETWTASNYQLGPITHQTELKKNKRLLKLYTCLLHFKSVAILGSWFQIFWDAKWRLKTCFFYNKSRNSHLTISLWGLRPWRNNNVLKSGLVNVGICQTAQLPISVIPESKPSSSDPDRNYCTLLYPCWCFIFIKWCNDVLWC